MKYSGHISLEVEYMEHGSRAECSCGWMSPVYRSSVDIEEMGMSHAKVIHGVVMRKHR